MARGKAADLARFPQLRPPRPLYEQLAEVVRQKILSGELKPGERLPAETDLASSLGVGRPSLREALKILQAMGVVVIRHGAGVYVTPSPTDGAAQRTSASTAAAPPHLRHLLETRKTLECQAAAWAAQRASVEAKEELGRLVAEMTTLVESAVAPAPAVLAGLDKAFHRRLALSTGNTALIGLLDTVMGMIEETMLYSLAVPGRPIQSVYDHRRVYAALAAGKPVAAARAMFAHLDGVQRTLFPSPTTETLPEGAAEAPEGVLVVTYRGGEGRPH